MKYILIGLSVLTLMDCSAALAQQQCNTRAGWMATLTMNYGEVLIWRGVATAADAPDILVELVTSPDGGTWSILQSRHGIDRVCMIASGSSWGVPALDPVAGAGL